MATAVLGEAPLAAGGAGAGAAVAELSGPLPVLPSLPDNKVRHARAAAARSGARC